MQKQDEEQLLRSVKEAINQREQLKRKIILAKIVNQKFTENLGSTRIERGRELANTEMLKQHVEDVMKAEQYAAWHVNKVKLELKRKMALKEEIHKMVGMLHQNSLDRDIEKAEKTFGNFYSDLANAPWLPEKREIQREFKKYDDELAKFREQVAEYINAISKIKLEAELHAKLPFKTFVYTLANYSKQSGKVCQLLKKEQKKAKQLREKLSSMSDEEIRNSGEQDTTIVEAAIESHEQRMEQESRNETIGEQRREDDKRNEANAIQQQPQQFDMDTQNDIVVVGQQKLQRIVEVEEHSPSDAEQMPQQLLMDRESQQHVFATPLPPVSAPRGCDDGDQQALFDFFGAEAGADQSATDGSFNFGSFMTTLAGPGAKKGPQKQQADGPGDSQSDFNFNAFLGKPDEFSKEVTEGGALFDFNF
ncbi:hypothetical protein niasHS_003282 [Heterodera schachtii]|uniref:Uncharacterized protein n=1 Tax=Heterodera schachtii TaxID=97005 RepID=A0ABD2KGK8_HETSC